MSAGSMRDKIIGAKYFDRVYYLIVDPDEFLIAGPDAYEAEFNRTHPATGDKLEKQNALLVQIMANYREYIAQFLAANLIEEALADRDGDGDFDVQIDGSPAYYKLTVRSDEGILSFSSIYTTLIREPDVEGPYEATLREDISGDLVIDSKLEGAALSSARAGATWV